MLNAMDAVLELEDLERQLHSYAREHHLDLLYAPLKQEIQLETSSVGSQGQPRASIMSAGIAYSTQPASQDPNHTEAAISPYAQHCMLADSSAVYTTTGLQGAAFRQQQQWQQQQQEEEDARSHRSHPAAAATAAAGAAPPKGHQLELYGAVVRASTRQLLQALRDAKLDQRSLLQQRQQLAAAQRALQHELCRLQQAAAALPGSPATSPPRCSPHAGGLQQQDCHETQQDQQQQQQVAGLLQQQALAMHQLKKRFIKAHRQLISQAASVQQQLDGATAAAEAGRRREAALEAQVHTLQQQLLEEQQQQVAAQQLHAQQIQRVTEAYAAQIQLMQQDIDRRMRRVLQAQAEQEVALASPGAGAVAGGSPYQHSGAAGGMQRAALGSPSRPRSPGQRTSPSHGAAWQDQEQQQHRAVFSSPGWTSPAAASPTRARQPPSPTTAAAASLEHPQQQQAQQQQQLQQQAAEMQQQLRACAAERDGAQQQVLKLLATVKELVRDRALQQQRQEQHQQQSVQVESQRPIQPVSAAASVVHQLQQQVAQLDSKCNKLAGRYSRSKTREQLYAQLLSSLGTKEQLVQLLQQQQRGSGGGPAVPTTGANEHAAAEAVVHVGASAPASTGTAAAAEAVAIAAAAAAAEGRGGDSSRAAMHQVLPAGIRSSAEALPAVDRPQPVVTAIAPPPATPPKGNSARTAHSSSSASVAAVGGHKPAHMPPPAAAAAAAATARVDGPPAPDMVLEYAARYAGDEGLARPSSAAPSVTNSMSTAAAAAAGGGANSAAPNAAASSGATGPGQRSSRSNSASAAAAATAAAAAAAAADGPPAPARVLQYAAQYAGDEGLARPCSAAPSALRAGAAEVPVPEVVLQYADKYSGGEGDTRPQTALPSSLMRCSARSHPQQHQSDPGPSDSGAAAMQRPASSACRSRSASATTAAAAAGAAGAMGSVATTVWHTLQSGAPPAAGTASAAAAVAQAEEAPSEGQPELTYSRDSSSTGAKGSGSSGPPSTQASGDCLAVDGPSPAGTPAELSREASQLVTCRSRTSNSSSNGIRSSDSGSKGRSNRSSNSSQEETHNSMIDVPRSWGAGSAREAAGLEEVELELEAVGADAELPNTLAAALSLTASTALNSCDSGYEPGAGEEEVLPPSQRPHHQQMRYINGRAQGSDGESEVDAEGSDDEGDDPQVSQAVEGTHTPPDATEQGELELTLARGLCSRTQSLPSSQPSLAFSSYLDQVAAEFEPESSDAEDMLGHGDM